MDQEILDYENYILRQELIRLTQEIEQYKIELSKCDRDILLLQMSDFEKTHYIKKLSYDVMELQTINFAYNTEHNGYLHAYVNDIGLLEKHKEKLLKTNKKLRKLIKLNNDRHTEHVSTLKEEICDLKYINDESESEINELYRQLQHQKNDDYVETEEEKMNFKECLQN